MLAIVLVEELIASLGGGVRWGLLTEILAKDGYLTGRSLFNMMSGLMQIAGYATGGVLVTLLSPRLCLLLAAALYGTSAALALRLTCRPPRVLGRPSVAATWRANALLWSARPRRHVYLALWVPNGLVVGCEVAVRLLRPARRGHAVRLRRAGHSRRGRDDQAAAAAPSCARASASRSWRMLAAPPLVLFLRPPLPLTAVLVAVTSVGFGRRVWCSRSAWSPWTPDELSGHALGLHSAGMLTLQGSPRSWPARWPSSPHRRRPCR